MNSEDEKRLAEIRARSAGITEHFRPGQWSASTHDRAWLLAKLGESERARKEAEASVAREVHWEERAERAEAALAEERDKRRVAEETIGETHANNAAWRTRARVAEAVLADALAVRERMRDVFAKEHDTRIAAENALADERAKWEQWYLERTKVFDAETDRAEAAEARVAELEALVDATFELRFGNDLDIEVVRWMVDDDCWIVRVLPIGADEASAKVIDEGIPLEKAIALARRLDADREAGK